MVNPVTYFLFCIFLLLCLGAIIAFSSFVIKPMQTRWAIGHARRILATNDIGSKWRFINVYRMLATARGDMEAAKLWQQLDAMREKGV
jgi:photosystem II stability/assembly factor-like uncharacterized protein